MNRNSARTTLISYEEILNLDGAPEGPPPVGSLNMAMLQPHQAEAVHKFGTRSGILAHQMGLGKTRTGLTILASRFIAGTAKTPGIYVGKLACIDSLRAEVVKLRQHGLFLRLALFNQTSWENLRCAHVVFITYESLAASHSRWQSGKRSRVGEECERWLWSQTHPLVVLDEAHEIANASTRRSKACHALIAEQRLAMTGSPIVNRLDDLRNLARFLGTLHEPLDAYFLARSREDMQRSVATAPRATLHTYYMRSRFHHREEAEMHARLLQNLATKLNLQKSHVPLEFDDEEAPLVGDGPPAHRPSNTSVFTAITYARQACLVPALVEPGLVNQRWATTHSTKLNMLAHYLKQHRGDRVVIMTFFRSAIPYIVKRLTMEGIKDVLRIDGTMKMNERERVLDTWRHRCAGPRGATQVLIATTGSSGVSLNMDGADRMALPDASFSPARREQFKHRVMRMTTEHDVVATEMILDGTIEACMDVLCNEKKGLATSVMRGKIRLNSETVQKFILRPLETQDNTLGRDYYDEERGCWYNVESGEQRSIEQQAAIAEDKRKFQPMFAIDDAEIEAMQAEMLPPSPEPQEAPQPTAIKKRKVVREVPPVPGTEPEEQEQSKGQEPPPEPQPPKEPEEPEEKVDVSQRRRSLAELVNYDVDAKGYLRANVKAGTRPVYIKFSASKEHSVPRAVDGAAFSMVFLNFADKEDFLQVVRTVLARDVEVKTKEDFKKLCREALPKEKVKGVYLERSKSLLAFTPKDLFVADAEK